MKITTRISTTTAPAVAHSPECERDHHPRLIRFTSASPNKGFGKTEALDCLLYEMEDAAFESIVAAYGSYGYDPEAALDAAAEVASRADGLLTGGKAHVRNTVAAA